MGGSSFLFLSLSPRSYGYSMEIMTQFILPFLSQHLPDLEQQSLDVGSVPVGMGLCRRGKKTRQTLDATRNYLLMSLRTFKPLPRSRNYLGSVEFVTVSPFSNNTCQSAYPNIRSSLILLLSPAPWLAEVWPGWQEAGAVGQASSQGNTIAESFWSKETFKTC